ncbi:hypothetical protein SNEBB_009772 [Seison nebaliae]|nr:hypothetical protein SNEBB_009772 [Seison nebaliae]
MDNDKLSISTVIPDTKKSMETVDTNSGNSSLNPNRHMVRKSLDSVEKIFRGYDREWKFDTTQSPNDIGLIEPILRNLTEEEIKKYKPCYRDPCCRDIDKTSELVKKEK